MVTRRGAVTLEQIVWPEVRHAVASHGRTAGMSEVDVARAEALLDSGDRDWIGADPDAFVVQPTLLWTGAPGRLSMANDPARQLLQLVSSRRYFPNFSRPSILRGLLMPSL
ncbi:hypothetical protein G3M53_01030 [Streptomyces sp. SID7982]|nr:hypothetical protein [Streptomyces sp. SID7982]